MLTGRFRMQENDCFIDQIGVPLLLLIDALELLGVLPRKLNREKECRAGE